MPACARVCLVAGAIIAGLVAVTSALSQTTLLPEACRGKTGEALDQCVRDATPSIAIDRIDPVDPSYSPAQMVNCLRIDPADRNFCVRRNEVILECRNAFKHADFDQCFTTYIVRAPKPLQLNCQREKPDRRASCTTRNTLIEKCIADPLRYFVCLSGK